MSSGAWTCPNCGEMIPDNFDQCWNCRKARLEQYDQQGESDRRANLADGEDSVPESERASLNCVACGADRMIPNVYVSDQGQYSSGHLHVIIEGNPEALIFKDRKYGNFIANICGECGHVQLRVENPAELYQHYLDARR